MQASKPKAKLWHGCCSSEGLQGRKGLKPKQAICFKTEHYILTCKTYRNVPPKLPYFSVFSRNASRFANIHTEQSCLVPLDT